MASSYAWVIKDSYIEDDVPIDDMGKVRSSQFEPVMGPHDATPEQLELARKTGTPFAIYDDDGVLYYRGRFVADDVPVGHGYYSDDAFGPLDDFGRPNAGAVDIKYRLPNGKWELL